MRTELTMTELEAVNGGGFIDFLKDAWETIYSFLITDRKQTIKLR